MNLSRCVRFLGGIDVFFILWKIFKDLLEHNLPFVNEFKDVIVVSSAFDETGVFVVLTSVVFVVMLSIAVSGVLMVMLHKVGVYISLLQLPFRLTLLLPFSFFFIGFLKFYVPNVFVVSIVFILEIAKSVIEILWLKEIRKNSRKDCEETK